MNDNPEKDMDRETQESAAEASDPEGGATEGADRDDAPQEEQGQDEPVEKTETAPPSATEAVDDDTSGKGDGPEGEAQPEAGADDDQSPECDKEANVVGIRFPNSGKTYCFCAKDLDLRRYDRVVVESDMGINIGQVAKVSCEMKVSEKDLKPVLRKVTEVDLQQEAENETVKQEAREYAIERIKHRGLPMKLLYADVTLDRKRFIFYFVADSRVDFRELVKDLASKFRSRIELKQIGVRDAAKMIGGFGVCGQELCCKTWLKGFAPISIKMAKQQDLVLNTCKLSGLCGRLMCCLNYEYDPNGPKRRKPEPRRKEVPSADKMEKAIDAAVSAGAPERQKPGAASTEAPATQGATEAPGEGKALPGKPGESDKDGKPTKRKRRRRGGRNRGKQAGKPGESRESAGATQAASEGGAPAKAAGPEGGDKPGGEKKSKPKRNRRRRRKPKDKKEE